MLDLLYIVFGVAFFAISIAYVAGLEKLRKAAQDE
jgi:hypothetical protein